MRNKGFIKIINGIIISVILAIVICFFALQGYFQMLLKVSDSQLALNEGHIIYSIQHETSPLEIEVESFNNLYQKLSENNSFQYFEIYQQYLEMPNQIGEFYEEGTDQLLKQCAGIKCVQISENLMDECEIKVSNGRLFEKKDFMYQQGDAIPVLMGNAYSSLYRIGDTFEAEYLFDQYEFSVIGFLSEENKIELASYGMNLDHYIVMPSFAIDENVPITDGLKIHYANKTSGLVRLNTADTEVFYDNVEPMLINANAGRYSWNITPIEEQYKDKFNMSVNQTKLLIIFITIFLIIGEVCLVYHFSKYDFEKKHTIVSQNLLYGAFVTIVTSMIYILITGVLMMIAGVKIMNGLHLIYIVLLSIGVVSLNYIFNKNNNGRK